ncbi:radical SAM protein [Shumkonia mesophila]|uniref:radical SAM protein n=1 Tax=Shumkonia mesophila TaxID=2838854 RepID=UPI002934D149|nr:radical SAM protein [Shumkonia mesophila]
MALRVIDNLRKLHEKATVRCGSGYVKRIVTHNPIVRGGNVARIASSVSRTELPANPTFMPPAIILEPTNRCNLRCETCILGTDRAYKNYAKRDLTVDDFRRVLDQIPTLVHIVLQGIGEPLLNESLPDMIRLARQRGITCSFNTNGTLMNEKKFVEVMEAGVEEISFSINSIDETVFAQTRSGASLPKVLRNLDRVLEIRRERGTKGPIVGTRSILMQETVPGVEKLVEYCADRGVDRVCFQDYLTGFGQAKMDESKVSDEEVKTVLQRLLDTGRRRRIQVINDKGGNGLGACRQPWLSPFITAEGYVTPCCTIADPSTINFGNILKEDFQAIWHSESYTAFRDRFYRDRPFICTVCPHY